MKNKTKSTDPIPLLVTTEAKGVFFGYSQPTTDKTIRLERARMCVYWCAGVHGVLGLAAVGPLAGSRVTPQIPAITLRGLTSVSEVSPEAVKAWEMGDWA